MMPNDFIYVKPETAEEAVGAFAEFDAAGQRPLYFAGGTEIITMARMNNIDTGAVIDIKGIPECNEIGQGAGKIIFGAAVSLAAVTGSKLFPLLGSTAARIADHTSQYKITLGGNISGTVIFHEAVLPLLLTDCKVEIAGPGGRRTALLADCFDKRVKLARGEFILSFAFDKKYASLPFMHIKRTEHEKIDYPLLTVAAMKDGARIYAAFSGLCGYPFRSLEMEDALSDRTKNFAARAEKAAASLPDPARSTVEGTAEYKIFLLRSTLETILERLEA